MVSLMPLNKKMLFIMIEQNIVNFVQFLNLQQRPIFPNQVNKLKTNLMGALLVESGLMN